MQRTSPNQNNKTPAWFGVERYGPGGPSRVDGVKLDECVFDQEAGGRIAAAVADGEAAPFFEKRQRDRCLRAGDIRQGVPQPVRGYALVSVLVDEMRDDSVGR